MFSTCLPMTSYDSRPKILPQMKKGEEGREKGIEKIQRNKWVNGE